MLLLPMATRLHQALRRGVQGAPEVSPDISLTRWVGDSSSDRAGD